MKSLILPLLFVFSLNCQLTAQQYDIYYSNFDTDLIQLNSPKQIDLGIGLGISGAGNLNLQLGYSPIKHLSIAAGYFTQSGNDGNDNSTQVMEGRKGYTITVGTYYYLLNKKADIFEPGTKIVDSSKRRSLLLTAELGFSENRMKNVGASFLVNGTISSSEVKIRYQSVFFNLGIGYEHKYGMTTATMGFKGIKYISAIYNGIFNDVDKLSAITQQLREDATYNIFGVGIHNQFGKKILKVQAGGTLPLVYFQDFKNQAAEIDNSSIYIGCIIDIQRSIKYILGSNK